MKGRKLITKDILPEPKATDDFVFLDDHGVPVVFMRADLIVKVLDGLAQVYDKPKVHTSEYETVDMAELIDERDSLNNEINRRTPK